MKKLLIILFGLCLIVLGASYWFGLQAETLMQASLERFTSNAPFIQVTLKEKHRGLFASTYTYTLGTREEGTPSKESRLVVDVTSRVAHGPIPIAAGSFTPCQALADSTFAVDPQSSQDAKELFDKFPELMRTTVRTRFAFDGTGVTDMAIPAFQKTITDEKGEPVTLDWQGLTARTAFDSGFTAYTMTIQAPLLRVGTPKTDMTFTGFTGDYDMKLAAHNLWTGKQRNMVKSLAVNPKTGGHPTLVQNLSLGADITPRAEVLDYALQSSWVLAPAGKPPLPMRLGVTLRDLDQAALGELYDLMRKPPAKAGEPPLSEADAKRVFQAMLARSPSVALNLEIKETAAPLVLNAEVRCEGVKTLPAQWSQALSLLRAQAGFEGSVKAAADLACRFQEAAETNAGPDTQAGSGADCGQKMTDQLDQFVQQGFVVRDGDKLTSKATWDGKELMVNGKRMF